MLPVIKSQVPPAYWQKIANVFSSEGIPVNVWQPIALAEGGGRINPNAVGDNGTSFGEFQLHKGGQLPSSWLAQAIQGKGPAFSPTKNAEVASVAIRKAYLKGKKLGYSGQKLTLFVASHSGHPLTLPDNQLESPATMKEAKAVSKYYQMYGNTAYTDTSGNIVGPKGFTSGIGNPNTNTNQPSTNNKSWDNFLISLHGIESSPISVFNPLWWLSVGIFSLLGLILIMIGLSKIINLSGLVSIITKV